MVDNMLIFLVGTECQPELEEKFNDWYDETHIPMLLKFDGLREVTRYRILNDTEGFPKYLAIYKFENAKRWEDFENSAELASARQETWGKTWKEGGFTVRWRVQYEAMKTWRKETP